MGLLASAEAAVSFPRNLLTAIFPDDCRICGDSLTQFTAVPVCAICLAAPRPFMAECCCQRCGTPFLSDASLDDDGVCRLCHGGRRGFDACFAYGDYTGELRQLIHVLKYEGVTSLSKPLAGYMLRGLPRHIPLDMVAAVPMHWWKQYRRGFNQAELLADEVARSTGLPQVRLLRRAQSSTAQAGLGSAERRRNAKASFALKGRRPLDGRRILLVDDVFTTGATAMACARLLKQAGASYVAVLTIARVDRRAPAPLYAAGSPDF